MVDFNLRKNLKWVHLKSTLIQLPCLANNLNVQGGLLINNHIVWKLKKFNSHILNFHKFPFLLLKSSEVVLFVSGFHSKAAVIIHFSFLGWWLSWKWTSLNCTDQFVRVLKPYNITEQNDVAGCLWCPIFGWIYQ